MPTLDHMISRRHRIRRTAKWMGTISCIAFLGAFIASERWAIAWYTSDIRHQFGIEFGGAGYGWRPAGWSRTRERFPVQPGWLVARYAEGTPSPKLWITLSKNRAWEGVLVPLWLPFLLIAAPTAILWYRDRRRIPPGHCPSCNYNLTGNTTGICPECGSRLGATERTNS